jgi:hypothetical protein
MFGFFACAPAICKLTRTPATSNAMRFLKQGFTITNLLYFFLRFRFHRADIGVSARPPVSRWPTLRRIPDSD